MRLQFIVVLCFWNVTALLAQAQQPYADSLRALIVLVRFADDTSVGDPRVNFREWPVEATVQPPSFASHLLSSSPHPPFADSSLTAYFHQQSQGHFILFGDVASRIHVTAQPESYYHRPIGHFGMLTTEVLTRLDDNGVDFRRYDYNQDGLLDHLFIIIRSGSLRDQKRYTWTGISCLDARCGGGLAGGGYRPTIEFDGIKVDWDRSGSINWNRTPGNVHTHYYLVRLMAHELGHDLWANHFVHIPAITSNDVPYSSNRSSGTNSLGYVLMAGAGGGLDCRGDETISAFERYLLGWIDCPILEQAGTYTLGDLYMTGDCFRIAVPSLRPSGTLFLSNRTKLGPFDRSRMSGINKQFDIGLLRTEGLLVHLANGHLLDMIPADNSLDLHPESPPYYGDLFGSNTVVQLTPWTRPNSNGYTHTPSNFDLAYVGLDQISQEEDGSLAFIFEPDMRINPNFRADAWFTPGQRVVRLIGHAEIERGVSVSIKSVVHIEGKLTIQSGGFLEIGPEGSLHIDSGAVLKMESGSNFIQEGTLHLSGLIQRFPFVNWIRSPTSTVFAPLN